MATSADGAAGEAVANAETAKPAGPLQAQSYNDRVDGGKRHGQRIFSAADEIARRGKLRKYPHKSWRSGRNRGLFLKKAF
jgi:hypothetical protein